MKIKDTFLRIALIPMLGGMMCACSDAKQELAIPTPLPEGGVTIDAPAVSMPMGEGNQVMTRGSFYDGAKGGVYFNWEVNDVVGIVPVTDGYAQQMEYVCKSVTTEVENSQDGVSRGFFKQEDANFAWTSKEYRAYYPYAPAATDATAITLDYTGQQQTGKPDMENYFNGDKANYYATEKTASEHLSQKTFLLSEVTQVNDDNILPFKMHHLGGIVRFYLALPATIDASVTEVRLVATKAVFHEHATLNAQTGATTPEGEPTSSIVLNVTGASLSGNAYGHYFVGYMMAYPVALTQDAVLGTTGKLYIYVKGKNSSDEDVYFRSGAVTKKDIAAGQLTQFAVKPAAENDPVEVQPITVQEWQEGLTLSNGEGTGTENW